MIRYSIPNNPKNACGNLYLSLMLGPLDFCVEQFENQAQKFKSENTVSFSISQNLLANAQAYRTIKANAQREEKSRNFVKH